MRCVKLFTLPTCPKCPAAKYLAEKLSEEEGVQVLVYDMSIADGLAEGSSYGVMGTPAFLVVEDPEGEDTIVKDWPGILPSAADILAALGTPRS